jgi:AAA domain
MADYIDEVYSGIPDEWRTKPPERERFKIHTASEALEPQPPVDWIVEKLFSAGSVSLVVGNPGSKKTYSMLSAGVCAAIGKKWLDFPTRQCKVLFVDEESGNTRMARRLGESLRREFADDKTPFEYISLAQFNLRDAGDCVLFQATIEQTGAELVVIDALADIMPGADENAVKDTHPIFMRMRKIAEETRAAIVVVHHANKAGDYRGSTAIKGAVDLLLMVDSKENSEVVDFETQKTRDVEPFKFSAAAHWSDNQFWLSPIETSSRQKSLTRPQRYVMKFLQEFGPSSRSIIITNPDTCTSRSASDAIYQLADMGLIYRTNPQETGRGAEAIYAIKQEDE